MSNIWKVDCRHSTFMHLAMPSDDCEDPIAVIHSVRGSSDPDRDIGIHGGRINTDVVRSVELTMRREDFEDDYFTWGGCMFVSQKLRNVMALDASVVEFFEVDDSNSAALPRSKNYQMMLPLLEDDASDRARSRYGWQMIRPRGYPGSVERRRIRPKKGDVPPYVYHIAIRPEFEPDCDLFYDSFFADTLFCTDALALRVLEAGCAGMSFVHPSGYRKGRPRVRRTLDGVEEDDAN
jgi:hypothetical protein